MRTSCTLQPREVSGHWLRPPGQCQWQEASLSAPAQLHDARGVNHPEVSANFGGFLRTFSHFPTRCLSLIKSFLHDG